LQGYVLGKTEGSPRTAIDVRRQHDVQPA